MDRIQLIALRQRILPCPARTDSLSRHRGYQRKRAKMPGRQDADKWKLLLKVGDSQIKNFASWRLSDFTLDLLHAKIEHQFIQHFMIYVPRRRNSPCCFICDLLNFVPGVALYPLPLDVVL